MNFHWYIRLTTGDFLSNSHNRCKLKKPKKWLQNCWNFFSLLLITVLSIDFIETSAVSPCANKLLIYVSFPRWFWQTNVVRSFYVRNIKWLWQENCKKKPNKHSLKGPLKHNLALINKQIWNFCSINDMLTRKMFIANVSVNDFNRICHAYFLAIWAHSLWNEKRRLTMCVCVGECGKV